MYALGGEEHGAYRSGQPPSSLHAARHLRNVRVRSDVIACALARHLVVFFSVDTRSARRQHDTESTPGGDSMSKLTLSRGPLSNRQIAVKSCLVKTVKSSALQGPRAVKI